MSTKIVHSTDQSGVIHKVNISELCWRPAAYGIVVDGENILLTCANDAFQLPGGGIELGESPEQAVLREIREETGLIVVNPRLVHSLSAFFSFDNASSQKQHVQSLLLYFVCDLSGSPSLENHRQDYDGSAEVPVWTPIAQLNHIRMGGTVDWRSVALSTLSL